MYITYIYGFMELWGERNAITITSNKPMERDDVVDWLCNNRASLYPYSFDINKVQWLNFKCRDGLSIPFWGDKFVLNNLNPTDNEVSKYIKSKNK